MVRPQDNSGSYYPKSKRDITNQVISHRKRLSDTVTVESTKHHYLSFHAINASRKIAPINIAGRL